MRSIYSENLALEKVDNMATKDGILLVKSQQQVKVYPILS